MKKFILGFVFGIVIFIVKMGLTGRGYDQYTDGLLVALIYGTIFGVASFLIGLFRRKKKL